ncbi:MAG: cupin domain-containing protein [Cyanobacteria bacterium P01_F01_bin.4]
MTNQPLSKIGHKTVTPIETDGSPQQVGPGDAFVVEKGFEGTWQIQQKVLKHFSIKLQ